MHAEVAPESEREPDVEPHMVVAADKLGLGEYDGIAGPVGVPDGGADALLVADAKADTDGDAVAHAELVASADAEVDALTLTVRELDALGRPLREPVLDSDVAPDALGEADVRGEVEGLELADGRVKVYVGGSITIWRAVTHE